MIQLSKNVYIKEIERDNNWNVIGFTLTTDIHSAGKYADSQAQEIRKALIYRRLEK